MSAVERREATATIQVSEWLPEPYDEPADGPSLVRIHVRESFTGDLSGEGTATMLQVLRADGSASFCALERVTGTFDGRRGTFVLQDAGVLDAGGRVTGTWSVVPESATGELAGLRGEGGFEAALGQHAAATLTWWIEE